MRAFGNLLPSAITIVCYNRAFIVQKLLSPFIYLELSHSYYFFFNVTFFKKDIRHNYIDLLTDIYLLRNHKFSDKHVYIHVYQDINMITWQIPFNMVPPSNDCCSNGFRHASFFQTDGDWFSDVFDLVDWQHMYQSISIYGSDRSNYIWGANIW